MANIDDIELNDTFLSSDTITSKHNDDDNIDLMSIRDYVKNMESLIEKIDRIASFGVDNSTEESMARTGDVQISKLFMLDVVKSTIVAHVKDAVRNYSEYPLRYAKEKEKTSYHIDDICMFLDDFLVDSKSYLNKNGKPSPCEIIKTLNLIKKWNT